MTIVHRPSSIVCLLEVTSTQDEARRILAEGREDVIGVRADYQSAGRGRSGNVWIAPRGTCLLCTYIIRGPTALPGRVARLAFAAGLAVADSIEALTGKAAGLKWPNDVMLSGRKAAGILVQTAPCASDPPAALVGIGLNVNVHAFPGYLERTATSLAIETGRVFEIGMVESIVRERLFCEVDALAREGLPRLVERWRLRDVTPGVGFEAELEGRCIRGVAVGVNDIGALILLSDSGEQIEVVSASSLNELG